VLETDLRQNLSYVLFSLPPSFRINAVEVVSRDCAFRISFTVSLITERVVVSHGTYFGGVAIWLWPWYSLFWPTMFVVFLSLRMRVPRLYVPWNYLLTFSTFVMVFPRISRQYGHAWGQGCIAPCLLTAVPIFSLFEDVFQWVSSEIKSRTYLGGPCICRPYLFGMRCLGEAK
jgi:hypothetical protein